MEFSKEEEMKLREKLLDILEELRPFQFNAYMVADEIIELVREVES
jgi:hypothetical protein